MTFRAFNKIRRELRNHGYVIDTLYLNLVDANELVTDSKAYTFDIGERQPDPVFDALRTEPDFIGVMADIIIRIDNTVKSGELRIAHRAKKAFAS